MVIAAGGALGGLARYGVGAAIPVWPWATFVVNVSGCLLIGALMAFIARRRPHSVLLRPFAGVGILGGYTTFSAYTLDILATVAAGRAGEAMLYLAATAVCAVVAVWAGIALTERVLR